MRAVTRWMYATLVAALAAALVLPAGSAVAQEENPVVDYEVVSELTNEPMTLDIADDGRIFWGQRDGTIFVMTPAGAQSVVAQLDTAGNLCPLCEPEPDYLAKPPNRLGVGGLEEGGLQGILLDDEFAENGQIYVYRSIPYTRAEVPAEPEGTPNAAPAHFAGEFHLSRFTVDHTTNLIDPLSEEVLLTVPAEWDFCCHYSGDLDYLPDGTITLTTGDDADAGSSEGYGPRDHTAFHLNAEWTSANPADRRGKVLRLTEEGEAPDGVSVINPDTGEPYAANPFIGMEGYIPDTLVTDEEWVEFDPYVYSMGWKQPWRAVVHPTGVMYVSDVGPDSSVDDPDRGSRGFEEINQVPAGGGTHAGWPRCVGPNYTYTDVNWETMEVGGPLDCGPDSLIARPVGSADETTWVRGMHPAEFYYANGASEEWPIVGTGGKTSEPVAFYHADIEGDLRLPEVYNDRLLVLEWSRNFILGIPSDPATGELNLNNDDMFRANISATSVNPSADNPQGTVSAQQGRLMAPIDGEIGPDGALYFLEYGAFFYAGANGRLSRIKCAGCAPSNPAANYGLPADGGAAVGALGETVTAGPGAAIPAEVRTLLLLGAAAGVAVLLRRRRRRLT